MRLAILGAGPWGRNHVRVFSELLDEERVAVYDPDPECRRRVTADHPAVELLDRPSLDGITAAVIATPASTHAALARDALDGGLDVLVEKPLALGISDAEELVERAERRGRILMVDHLLRYHPAVEMLRGWLRDGTLGDLLHLTAQRLNLGVIRTEENAWWSLAPHDLSVLLDLVDEEATVVRVAGGHALDPERCDVAHADLRFPGGVTAHVHVSWLDPVKVRRLTVVGTRSMAVLEDGAENALVRYDHRVACASGKWSTESGPAEVATVPSQEPLRRVAAAFLESVETRVPPGSDGRDGARVVRILEAGQRSLDREGAPITLGGRDG
ncbi:MAG: Gfo/Idh/MocA family oxidoreductase [Candidatus Bipolaricaulota bacterium]|nr:MAG: Gfo/Idh/MocA family oxidoreductase [Candidatus Bipolaricaulota bacterium]